jgi:hypothetical protein
MTHFKKQNLNIMYDWCLEMFEEFTTSTAPIIKSNQIQNLQLLAKTLILFLQRSFSKSDLINDSIGISQFFDKFISLIEKILNDNGETFLIDFIIIDFY